jgi:hypothetical protein
VHDRDWDGWKSPPCQSYSGNSGNRGPCLNRACWRVVLWTGTERLFCTTHKNEFERKGDVIESARTVGA